MKFTLSNLVDVSFVPARPYFIMGDLIQGNMTLSSLENRGVVGSVKAEVICTADAFFNYYIRGDDSGGFIVKQVTHHYVKTPPLIVLDARATGGVTLSSALTQPIGLQIPVTNDMPSTLTERTASYKNSILSTLSRPMSVSHTLKLTIYGMTGEVVNQKTFALDIRALYLYPNADKPLKVYDTVMTGSCCSSNVFTFYCVTDRTMYGPGDRMRLSYWYNTKNPGSMPKIVSVTVKLSMSAKSFSPNKTPFESPSHSLYYTNNLFENSCTVPSFGEVMHIFVDVPMDVCPDFNLVDAPHPLTYKHELVMILGVEKRKVVILVPVVFNSLSLGHLVQFPFPVMQKPLPHSTVQAQEFYVSHPNPPALTATSVASAVTEATAVAGPVGLDSVQLDAGTSYTQVPTKAV